MAKITIYTDGACSGNPGPGGWAAILICGPHRKEISDGQYVATTSNEMELRAVYEGLKALNSSAHDVTIYTDSQNVIVWLSLGWKRKAAHLHVMLTMCDELMVRHNVSFEKVAGHSGDRENERVDALAQAAANQAVADHRRDCQMRPRHS